MESLFWELGRLMLHSYLAFEICAKFEPNGRLHTNLHGLLRNHPANATLQQKWQFYAAAAHEIATSFALVDRGCWDYYDDNERALADYDQWVNGMVTEEGARNQPSGGDPYRGEPRYLTFTMAFLIVRDSPCDLAIRQLCEIPDDMLWHRTSFLRILGGMRMLNFASIKSDCAYLIPRDNGWGLTQQDLAQSKFDYLRPIGA